MAKNWWKFGLCIFAGLGIGYVAGVKTTRDRAEKEKEQAIESIREIYRSDRKAKHSKKEQKAPERVEPSTKTSIQMEQLSKRKERADEAMKRYSGMPPALEDEPEDEDDDNRIADDPDYIHVVDEFPEDDGYADEVLAYYQDGVLAYAVSGMRIPDNEVAVLVGEKNLKKLEDDADCNQIYVVNNLYQKHYTVIFRYEEWAQVVKEEPYKAKL